MNDKPIKNDYKSRIDEYLDPKTKRFKEGNPGGPGRPPGRLNFKTIFEEAIKKISISENIKECEIEKDLVVKAIKQANKGNYNYYRDLFDRLYGKPLQKIAGDEENPLFPDKIEVTFKQDK